MKSANKNGLTLIEVIVSMAILGMIVLIILPVLTNTMNYSILSGRKTTSTYGSLSKIEDIKGWTLSETITSKEGLITRLEMDGFLEEEGVYRKVEGTIVYELRFIFIDEKEAIHLLAKERETVINEFYYILYYRN